MVDHTDYEKHIGQHFGNYRSLVLLGTSYNASIYLGEHVHLKTQATIRLYQLRLFHSDQQNFLHEARIIARLVHPHIVRVLESGMERDMPYLITSYPPGGTLRQYHPIGTSLSLPTILSYVKPTAAALDYAHKQQVLHLDIKPENIWLGCNHTLMIDNFRITLFSHSSRSESIQETVDVVAYMAPEQIQGRACPASDQYALGVMVYEWLCGSRPFSSNDYVEIARQHLDALPPALVERVPGLSLAVEHVVMRALAKDTAQRFPTIQAFVDALEQSFLSPNTINWHASEPSHHDESSTSPLFAPTSYSDIFYNQSHILQTHTLSNLSETPLHTKRFLSRRKVIAGLLALTGAVTVGTSIIWFSRSSLPANPHHSTKPAPRGTTFHIYRGHADIVYAAAWSRDGRYIASWSRDDTMQIWDATTLALKGTYPMANILSWSPDWHYIASGSLHSLQVWEMATGWAIITYPVPNMGAGPGDLPANSSVQWSPDGKYVATAFEQDSAQIWDTATGKTLFSYPSANSIAWSPDGKRIALRTPDAPSTDAPGSLQILDVATENQILHHNIQDSTGNSFNRRLVWSPNGKYLASSSGQIWDAASGRQVSTLKGLSSAMATPFFTRMLAWSPDSKYLASCDDTQAYFPRGAGFTDPPPKVDTVVHIWNTLTGEEIFAYDGHTAGVNYIAWSPDGTKISSASADMTVRMWQAI